MKKTITGAFALILTLALFTGCSINKTTSVGKTPEGACYNAKFNETEMVTVEGNKINIKGNENVNADKQMGMGMIMPKPWKEIGFESLDMMVAPPYELHVDYLTSQCIEELQNFDFENATEEETEKFFTEVYSHSYNYLVILRLSEDGDTTRKDELESQYEYIDLVATVGTDKYFVAYNTELPDDIKYSDADMENVKKLTNCIDEVKSNLILFPAIDTSKESNFNGSMTNFTTKDTEGNEQTQDIFKDYDITMVNIWTTWCGFCVKEMPELEDLYKGLPENVNMITVCSDADDDSELANSILDESGATFTTLVGNDELDKSLLGEITGFPTTIFVDSTGKVVSEIQIGAPGDDVVAGYNTLIKNALAKIGK